MIKCLLVDRCKLFDDLYNNSFKYAENNFMAFQDYVAAELNFASQVISSYIYNLFILLPHFLWIQTFGGFVVCYVSKNVNMTC